MALSEKTATKHNIKRAEVFAKHGLNTLDLNTVKPHYAGRSRTRDEECILCGQQHLKYLFTLHFAEPQGLVALAKVDTGIDREGAVDLTPVGSKCINDWIDALPETQEKLDLLKRWAVEVQRMKADMKAEIVRELCRAAGYATPEEAASIATAIFTSREPTARDDYYSAAHALGRREMRFLQKRILQIHDARATRPTTIRWLDNLARARAAIEVRRGERAARAAAASVAPAKPKMLQEIRELLDKGKVAFAKNPNVLNDKSRAAYVDIAKKVEDIGYFVTTTQANYFRDLVRKLETGK